MRYALLLLTLFAVVLGGCTSNRARRLAYSPGTVVRVSETYSAVAPSQAGEVVRVSAVYSDAMPARMPARMPSSQGQIVHVSDVYSESAPVVTQVSTRFVPPPPPSLPPAEVRMQARTACVPAARPAPARAVCVPACKPAAVYAPVCKPPASQCVGGNCGIPDPCDPCPGGVCGVPSLDACAPPMDFDPCGNARKR